MKNSFFKMVFSFSALLFCIASVNGEREVVFKDEHLQTQVKEQLNAPLTPENLAAMTYLHAFDVEHLEGIEFCVNLQDLNLSGGRISDLHPLGDLKSLRELNLSNNLILSVEPLSGLTALESLDLGLNLIRDLRPLAGLTKLRELALYGNRIFDLRPLAGMTQMRILDLSANPLFDLGPLSHLKNLESLALMQERTFSWADGVKFPIAQYVLGVQFAVMEGALNPANSMNVLNSYAGRITRTIGVINISPLAGCEKLKGLLLGANRVHDLRPLGGLKELTWLSVPENFITDLTPLTGMEEVEGLRLEQNLITDLEPLLVLGRAGKLKNAEIHLVLNPLSLRARKQQLPELKRYARVVTFTTKEVMKYLDELEGGLPM
ncbi:MAG TPA: leucine-rich repeat domain-containing protein [bacterium]|nr:leucine-rich repeat domain-containing protein [bacterium]